MIEANNDLRGRDVLVIGGAGYIGAVVVPDLLAAGARVRILDRLIYDNGFAIQQFLDDENVSFHFGDMGSPEIFATAAQGASDVLLLASLVGDPICKKYPELAVRTNEEVPIQIMESLDSLGIERFVFLSTCSNYGLLPEDVLATEDSELNPQSLYARNKIRVEGALLERGATAGYCGSVMRLATAYGLSRRMRFDLTISQFTWEIVTGSGLLVYDADTWRPYVHVRDVSRAIQTILAADPALVRNEVFNIGDTNEQFTKRMIVEEIQKYVADADIEFRTGDTDPRNYRVSFEKVADKLGFQCQESVRAHVPRLVEAIERRVFEESVRSPRYGNYEVVPSYAQVGEPRPS